MHAIAARAQSPFVSNERGADIQRRLTALNLSDRDFERRTGVERKTLRRAIDEGTSTRESTWRSIETELDRLEARFRGEPTTTPAVGGGEPHIVTIRGTRGGDIDVVVSGPIEDADKLKEIVEGLLYPKGRDEDQPET